MLDFLGLAILIIIAVLFGWVSLRARRAKSALIRWSGAVLAASLSAVVASMALIMVIGLFKLHARSAPAPLTKVAGTPEQIQRGKVISDGFCSACHSKTGTLTGGPDLGEHFPVAVGSFISANLTPAGRPNSWTDADIFRAIRNSVDADGRWLIIMSYTNAGKLSDEDIHAVIAYIRSLPAAGNATEGPPDHLNLLGIAMLGAGMLPMGNPIFIGPIAAPPASPTSQYGEYILSYQDCRAAMA
jgi:mono/diheme cytochrome c family protein